MKKTELQTRIEYLQKECLTPKYINEVWFVYLKFRQFPCAGQTDERCWSAANCMRGFHMVRMTTLSIIIWDFIRSLFDGCPEC